MSGPNFQSVVGRNVIAGTHASDGGIINFNLAHHDRCLADLRTTDPRHDKKRIEDTKGGLLADAYRWILHNPDFERWRDDPQSRLLWIKGSV